MVEAAGKRGRGPEQRTEKVLADKRARPSYHAAMNTLRLLFGVAMVGALHHPAFADQVNLCRDANGRQTMTDRPCGDPSMKRFQERRTEQIAVDQIQAKDMFSARTKVQKAGSPITPEALEAEDGGAVPVQSKSGLF